MSEKIVEMIIGAAYVAENGRFYAADIYKGNYYKIMENNTVKIVALLSRDYERVVAQYQECVKNDKKITSAYELNARAHHNFEIPQITADPEAAEKEWYIRTHPQVVETPAGEEPKKKMFGRRGKKNIHIKCLECGTINDKEQKFCGECGKRLIPAQEEILNAEDKANQTPKEERSEEALSAIEPDNSMVKQQEDQEIEIIEIDSKQEKKDKKKKSKKTKKEEEVFKETSEAETKASRPKKRRIRVVLLVMFFMILLSALGVGAYLYLTEGSFQVIYNDERQTITEQTEITEEERPEGNVVSYVVIKSKNDIAVGQKITEKDIEGTILSAEQYEKYNEISVYIDKNGEQKEEDLIMWEEKDSVVGKYAAREIKAGSILYDTSVTNEHVVADKTFVDIEIDGEGNTIEVESNELPGNTRIQIVAIIQTDGGEASQVLLSEMTLQDRSLESIFNSAGQDILEMISTKEDGQGTEGRQEQSSGVAETDSDIEAGE